MLDKFPIQEIENREKGYPETLKTITKPPQKIFFRGVLPLAGEKCFAIVGTRRASDYGKEAAFNFAKTLSLSGITIVSGMALGIDTWAHKGALSGNGKTIAVLGAGLGESSIYPQENLKLAKEILEKGGGIVSEYIDESPGFKGNFLQRNRLISGLSLGVLVIEAKIKSGALNTASWAKKQNKKVFALPGAVNWPNSRGCHLLIKQGVKLAETPKDILEELGLKTILQRNKTPQGNTEQAIYNCLKNGPLHIDKIIEITKIKSPEALGCMSLMEIQEKVKNFGANIYGLVKN